MDYEWRPTDENLGERTAIFCFDLDEDNSRTVEEMAATVLEHVRDNELKSRLTNKQITQLETADHTADAETLTDIMDTLELQYVACEESYESYIRKNAIFFTQKDASTWLEANKHNCTSDAHTYAMYGGYSDEVSRLFKILEQTDWSQLDAK